MTPGQGHRHDDILETLYNPRSLSLGKIKIVKIDLKMTQAILAHIFFTAQLLQRMSRVKFINSKTYKKFVTY